MAHPLADLRRLINNRARTVEGTVLVVESGRVLVSTGTGTVTADRQTGDATAYRSGDAVRLRDGVLVGKRVSRAVKYVV